MKTRRTGNRRMFRARECFFRTFLTRLPSPSLPPHLRIRSEQGKSLPAALITLAVGALLLTPFLSFVSSRSLGSRAAESAIAAQYAADSGIEFGIWSLLYDTAFRSAVDNNPGIAQALSLPVPGTLNGFTPTISVTGLPIGTWSVRPSAPADVNRGGALAYAGGDEIYALRGDNSRDFGYYSISAPGWHSLADTFGNVQQGGALAYGGGNNLYALRGSNSKTFWQYNIATTDWSTMEETPSKVRQGGELVWDGGDYICAFMGAGIDFWCYSIPDKIWEVRANAPASVGYGSDLVSTGGDSIYAFRGGNSQDFWHYSISSNAWTSLANAPASVTNGGGLAYHSGSYIYALTGGSNLFWRYTIGTNTWFVLTNTPAAVGRGGDLLFTQATTGFAQRGGNQLDFWEFEVTPPRFDIHADAGSVATDVRIEINGLNSTVLFWDIE